MFERTNSSESSSLQRNPYKNIVCMGICKRKINKHIRTETTLIKILVPSFMLSVFDASNTYPEIPNRTIKKVINRPERMP